MWELLERSNYTCCVCHGAKSRSYVVHHIEEYALTRNNSYSNLAVLCPADHDLAHMKGRGLSAKLTADQIRHAKAKWEVVVERQNVMKACNVGDISHVEFCNIPRIYDLCLQHFGSIPEVPLTSRMLDENLIFPSGFVNDEFLNGRYPGRLVTPLKYPFAGGAGLLRSYLFQLFQEVVKVTGVEDLDSLLNRSAVSEGNLVGRMCLYVGGVYGKQPKLPVTEHTPMVHMYLRRNPSLLSGLWIRISPRPTRRSYASEAGTSISSTGQYVVSASRFTRGRSSYITISAPMCSACLTITSTDLP